MSNLRRRTGQPPPGPVLVVSWVLASACTGTIGGGQPDAGGGTDAAVEQPDAAPPPPRVDPSAFLFEEDTIRDYYLTVTEADWQWLQDHALDETYVPAALRFGDEQYDLAAVRYKGAYGSLRGCFDGEGNRTCKKLSLKVSLNEFDPDGRFHGLKKLLFHSMVRDPSQMREVIAYKLFREFGVEAPRAAYARLHVNDEELGLFAFVEYVDGRFTRRVFEDGGEGNLYKEAWPTVAFADEDYWLEHLRTNEDDAPSIEPMIRFGDEIIAAGPEGFSAVASDWGVLDQLNRYMAVARLLDHWDGIVGWYCTTDGSRCVNHNFYWYQSTVVDRVWLIPWDMDHTISGNPHRAAGVPEWDVIEGACELIQRGIYSLRGAGCDPLIAGMATSSWDGYAQRSQELLSGAFTEEALNARIDALAAIIESDVTVDTNGPGLEAWQSAVTVLRDRVVEKRAMIEDRL